MFQSSKRITAHFRSLKNTPSSAELAAAEERVWDRLMHIQATSPAMQTLSAPRTFNPHLAKGFGILAFALCLTLLFPLTQRLLTNTPTSSNTIAAALSTQSGAKLPIRFDESTVQNQPSGPFGYLAVEKTAQAKPGTVYASGATYQPVYYTAQDGAVIEYNLATKKKRQVGPSNMNLVEASFNSQSQLVMAAVAPPPYPQLPIYKDVVFINPTTNSVVDTAHFTYGGEFGTQLIWSPDGKSVIFWGTERQGVYSLATKKMKLLDYTNMPLIKVTPNSEHVRAHVETASILTSFYLSWLDNEHVVIPAIITPDPTKGEPPVNTNPDAGPWYSGIDIDTYYDYHNYVISIADLSVKDVVLDTQSQQTCTFFKEYSYEINKEGQLTTCDANNSTKVIVSGTPLESVAISTFANKVTHLLTSQAIEGSSSDYRYVYRDANGEVISSFDAEKGRYYQLIGDSGYGIYATGSTKADFHLYATELHTGENQLLQ